MNAIEILEKHIAKSMADMRDAVDAGRHDDVRELYEQVKACDNAIDVLRAAGYPAPGDEHAEAEPDATHLTITLLGECPFLRYHNRALSAEEVAKDYASWATRRKIADDVDELWRVFSKDDTTDERVGS